MTASLLNTHVRDNLNALYGSVTNWTPQIDQGASTNIAKTVTEARYVQMGVVVHAWFLLAITASGTGGSAITITLPITATGHSSTTPIGSGLIYDSSATNQYLGSWSLVSTTQIALNTNVTGAGAVGASPSFALASGDSIRGHLMYLV
jgi:hypothetical protein